MTKTSAFFFFLSFSMNTGYSAPVIWTELTERPTNGQIDGWTDSGTVVLHSATPQHSVVGGEA